MRLDSGGRIRLGKGRVRIHSRVRAGVVNVSLTRFSIRIGVILRIKNTIRVGVKVPARVEARIKNRVRMRIRVRVMVRVHVGLALA